MDEKKIKDLLERVQAGQCDVAEALHGLKKMESDPLGFACLDDRRAFRTGIPEVVYGENKSAEQICAIFLRMLDHGGVVMATRVNQEKAASVCGQFPQAFYHEEARMVVIGDGHDSNREGMPLVAVLSAGTSDLPVAEEARLTAHYFGNRVEAAYDVGVAGIHRLFAHHDLIVKASVLIVVAGMEGALPSVIAGLTAAPVIAVPTSVGYGAGFGGLAAILGMLSSCAPGMSVVNIDNGFGAGCMASKIAKMIARKSEEINTGTPR